jgi:hypothetical protein
VIALLGVKLSLSVLEHFYPDQEFIKLIEGREADIIMSGVTVAIFIVPVFTSRLFNFPPSKRQ